MSLKVILFAGAAIATLLWAYQISSPRISLSNSSDHKLIEATISLAKEQLKFGELQNGEDKELSYSLLPGEGEYTYRFELSDHSVLSGKCGHFTNFEISKRVIFLVSDKQVIAQDIHGKPMVCDSLHVSRPARQVEHAAT
ncbi:hypothetical protein [Alteromonas lipolytica]|uniref:Uncharacterized protein n=1 Tax=Alteromonas lipolytica TaxID=1856405 RepID=A0A1E8FIT7_9ALTE|nr:hypothetical protein [Alteromonas lipolytica]OFI35840.1 hypothetical protein BFC17_11210 [Alteromonas lipolytica]GGF81285.1 hypothetical protein GCM10011338_36880 [Alteromonas lipolytica]